MKKHIVKIIEIENVTHDVKRFAIEKPDDYEFVPGQATEVSINLPDWKDEGRPFTFTSLNEWLHLEFIIKIYQDHEGLTQQLGKLQAGDELIVHEIFGAIQYKGEGTFIAGGAGVTPFIAIIRQLNNENKLGNNKLIFSNKTEKDIILKDEFTALLGNNFINTLTDQKTSSYDNRLIDKEYLSEKISNFSRYFYICGPEAMVEDVQRILIDLGADEKRVVVEEF